MLPYLITLRESPPHDIAKRHLPKVIRAALKALVNDWRKRMLPKHFIGSNRDRYDFQPRGKKYRRIKRSIAKERSDLVKAGGNIDLVRSGTMKAAMLRPHPIRAFAARATMIMPGPVYLTERPRDPRKPNMAFEITQVLPGEEEQLSRMLDDYIVQAIADFKTATRTTRI